MDTDSDNATVSDREVALRRELEACEVRLRLLNTPEGHARAGSLLREFQVRRDAAETRLGKLLLEENPAAATTGKSPEPSAAHSSDACSPAPPPNAAEATTDHTTAPSAPSAPPAKPRRTRRTSPAARAAHASPHP
jgi:hypothetical protein